ncbi:hypothetical protein HZB03_02365 [Candidatus Woesearchaeota archaeon]|nr:hypothetical protein [Candidatus Woesearchaeota archaeon]
MVWGLLPVTGKDFINRTAEIDDILRALKDPGIRIGYAISAPVGTGKTSLLQELARRLALEQRVIPIYFSLQSLSDVTLENFVKRFVIAILQASESKLKLRHDAKDLMESPLTILDKLLRDARISDELREAIILLVTFEREKRVDKHGLVEAVFDLPEKIAKETDSRCVFLLDEFTLLADLKPTDERLFDIFSLIRSVHEKHQRCVLVVTSSNQKAIDSITLASDAPFYHQFMLKHLKNFSREATKQLYEKNLDKRINDAALKEIFDFTQGSPFYLQFLGRMLKGAATPNVTEDVAKNAIEEFLHQEGEMIFREKVKQLSAKERLILSCMAQHGVKTPSEIGKIMNYSQTNVRRFLAILEEKGVLVNTSRGVFVFEDLIFKRWLAQQGVVA